MINTVNPANTMRWFNAGLMLADRLRCWTNARPAMVLVLHSNISRRRLLRVKLIYIKTKHSTSPHPSPMKQIHLGPPAENECIIHSLYIDNIFDILLLVIKYLKIIQGYPYSHTK